MEKILPMKTIICHCPKSLETKSKFTDGKNVMYHKEITSLQVEFSPPSVQKKTPLEYFSMFFPESLLRMIVDNTNLYSVQKTPKVSKQV